MVKNLTQAEIDELRSLIPLAKQIKAEAEFSAAKTLVWKTYRQWIIGLAAVVVAVATLKKYIVQALGGIL